jgi:hypothetical protein
LRLKTLVPRQPGDRRAIVAIVRSNGRCAAEEFIQDLRLTRPKLYAVLYRRLVLIKEHGNPRNEDVLKSVRGYDGILEVRHHNKQFRVTCFLDQDSLVCVDGFLKKADRDKRATGYYSQALEAREQYFREKRQ